MENNKFIFSEAVDINPKRNLKKGETAKFIDMKSVEPFTRKVLDITEKNFNGSGSKFENGDTIFARITPCLENGKTAYIDNLQDNKIAFGSTEFIVFSGKENITDNKFVYYLSRSPQIREYAIKNMVGTSGRQRVDKSCFDKLEISIPSLEKQKEIALVLSNLDDKIELNNEMNKTLEEMAQAMFKSWFIDFEPFKDGEFEESELGMIPKGWKICLLKDISNITMGQSPSSETYNEDKEGLAFYQGVKDFTDRFPLVSTYCREPKKVAMPGEILLSVRAPVGRINISMEKCCIGRGCAALSSEKYGNGFLYYLLRNIKWDKYESGTVFTSIKKSDIENYKVILPNIEIVNKFNKIINSLDNRILNNSVQNRDLEETRDILLPKLISGEIKL